MRRYFLAPKSKDTNGLDRIETAATGAGGGQPLVTLTSTFDMIGSRVELTDDPGLAGGVTTFDFDFAGRLEQLTTAAGTQTSFAYADPGCPGQVTGVTAALGLAEEATTGFAYDPASCLLTQTTDAESHQTALAYDAAGNVVSLTDPELRETRFQFDDLNRLTKLIDATNAAPDPTCATAGVTCFAYDAAGNLMDVSDGNGNLTSFDYDSRERPIERVDPLGLPDTFAYYLLDRMTRRTNRSVRTANPTTKTPSIRIATPWPNPKHENRSSHAFQQFSL